MNGWLNNILSGAFAQYCLLCEARLFGPAVLCDGCQKDLNRNTLCCAVCAEPLTSNNICGACQKTRPTYNRIVTPLVYGQTERHLVHRMKFASCLPVARLFAQLIWTRIKPENPGHFDRLLPLPLHSQRYQQRGFNQSLEIARALSRLSGIPCDFRLLKKVKDTPAQSLARDLAERRRNIRGAFQVNRRLHEQRLVIIDDVVTSGSTVSEASRCLQRAGAKHVEVWAACRAPRQHLRRPG